MQRFLIVIISVFLAACSTFGVIENRPIKQPDTANGYSITKFLSGASTDTSVMLAFSGGGTRAAALSYGVLKALRDTPIKSEGKSKRLLDEVGNISAVSGGSFTAAYYGLHGDRTFDRFEEAFLRRNIEGGLKKTLLNRVIGLTSAGILSWRLTYINSRSLKEQPLPICYGLMRHSL